MIDLKSELIQIRPPWYPDNNRIDVSKWSRISPRFMSHDGCIVDLGCLGWNKDFYDLSSHNWSGYFIGKKRVIGVDPQESQKPGADFFHGFVSNFTGRGDLENTGGSAKLVRRANGQFLVLSFTDFKWIFNIESISILKVNIEGGEWDLIDSFKKSDFEQIDQICVSFHEWLPEFREFSSRTSECVHKIVSHGFDMIDLGIYGWKLFLRNKSF